MLRPFIILAYILLVCVWTASHAAQPDNRGTEFYCTFLPNYHAKTSSTNDSLYIVVAAEQAATGTITMRDINGIETSIGFTVANTATVFRAAFPWKRYELRGNNRNEALNTGGADNQNGKIAAQSFRITADNDITVYALSQATKTSDAMMLLPVDVLGTSYRIMAYNSDARVETDIFGSKRLTAQSTPSQLAITAIEDGTSVVISPSVRVRNGITAPFTIELQRGDSYLLQADMYTNITDADLTGTLVQSTKPIAVFAGHQRSLLPVYTTTLESRDFLVEQLPPISTWGRRYLLTPFPQPTKIAAESKDLYRILAAHNNTEVRIGTTIAAELQAGQYYEAPLTEAALIETSNDVLVAQYKGSSQNSDSGHWSDPFFIIVPPLKQFMNTYTFASTQIATQPPTYREQYITVFCPTTACPTLKLDGAPIDQSLFRPVPSSCYSYAWVRVSDGVHRIEAEKKFGLYVYGYGVADSYGYVGGMAFTSETEPDMVASGDTTVCRGGTVQLRASGGISYYWKGENLSCTECPAPTATPEASTEYTVAIIDDNGCAFERKVAVRINEPPNAVCSADTTICTGSSTAISVSGGSEVQWSPAEGLSCTTCFSPTANPALPTTYTAVVTSKEGCTATDSVRIEVVDYPVVRRTADTTICPNIPVELHAEGGTEYTWFPAEGLSCTTCAAPTVTTDQSRTYYVRVRNSALCSTTDSVRLTVEPCNSMASITKTITFDNQSVCDSAVHDCVLYSTGEAPLSIEKWEVRGNNVSSFTVVPMLPAGASLPLDIAPGDSLVFRVVFRPDAVGLHTAELAIATSSTAGETVCALLGASFRTPLAITLVPRSTAADAGTTVSFDVRAEDGDWTAAALTAIDLYIDYEPGWIQYAGAVQPNTAIDATWQITAREMRTTPTLYTTALSAQGATPVRLGTIATVQMNVFLDADRTVTPVLRAYSSIRAQCVELQTTAEALDVSTCARSLRAIQYTGQPVFFKAPGSTVETDGMLELHYGVPFACDVYIAVYTATGQLLYEYGTVYSAAAEARHSVDLRRHAQQMLTVQCRIANYWMSRQVLLVR